MEGSTDRPVLHACVVIIREFRYLKFLKVRLEGRENTISNHSVATAGGSITGPQTTSGTQQKEKARRRCRGSPTWSRKFKEKLRRGRKNHKLQFQIHELTDKGHPVGVDVVPIAHMLKGIDMVEHDFLTD